MTRNYSTCLYFLLIFLAPVFSRAQHAPPVETATIFDHWYAGDTAAIQLTINTDLAKLFRNNNSEEYQSASIKAVLANGEEDSYEIKIRLRGNMRRKVCAIPPIKLKFKKKDLTSRDWLPHNDLKLVLSCRDNSSTDQDLIAEFLTYRMYEQISPISLRVQIVRLLIVDSEGKKNDEEMTAFIIEPIETLAARFNLQESVRSYYRESFLEKDLYREMAFFQYMIGNTDWNVYNHHNLYFVGGTPYQRLVVVPYDFDYSAVVGTHYAVPYETLPIKAVTQRLYRGLRCTEEEALALIETFASREADILRPVETFPMLTEGKRKAMLNYLTGFFKQLEKTKGLIWELGQ